MADFTDEHKAEREFKKYFSFGIHKVKILGFSAEETESGKEFIKVGFTDETGEIEDEARVWFTTDEARGFSFSTLRSIFVHNAPEDKKELARDAVNACNNHIELTDLLNKKLIGKEMWITKYLDPKRTYEAKNGTKKPSINTNIYGYLPTLKPDLMPAEKHAPNQEDVTSIGFEEDVPFNDDGSEPQPKKAKTDDWS